MLIIQSKLADRGILVRVSDEAYMVFYAIDMSQGIKDTVVTNVMRSEDVQFNWCLVSYDLTDEISDSLLKKINDVWITIRVFSFAGSSTRTRTPPSDQRGSGKRYTLPLPTS